MKIKDILSILACPEDHSFLEYHPDFLECVKCGRQYPVLGNNFVELLPGTMSFNTNENPAYLDDYKTEFEREFTWMKTARAWGRCDLAPAAWAAKRLRQVDFVKKRLETTNLICDVSGGAGTYTFEFAKSFSVVIHCDLSVENLNDVYFKMQQKKIDNLILIRCDYFKLPFHKTLPQLICTDTLIRGHHHERRLLLSLWNALSDSGHALVDFHNFWHNPLRRLGLMPENFGDNSSYSRKDAEKMLLDSGIAHWDYFPFIQESLPEKYSFLKKIIPPTRLMYRLKNENSPNT